MTRLLLAISEAEAKAALEGSAFDEVFLWTGGGRCTFVGTLDPYLSTLGAVNARNIDLVRIALAVLASDRSVLRKGGGSSWNAREFDLTVQVIDPDAWAMQADRLSRIVGFLSGDRWTFRFMQAPPAGETTLPVDDEHRERTLLLSGGADSAAGALLSALMLGEGQSQALVSHFSSTAISPVQQRVKKAIDGLAPGAQQVHCQFRLSRGSKRLDTTSFRDEPSTRSRSLLFLALGLAVAERASSPLWIAENGFASLNPPLGPDRRGSLSTHTTHPRFLHELADLMKDVGGHGLIENPFAALTKGDMFRRLADAVGVDMASTYLSQTNSCSHTDARFSGVVGASCGVCFGCLVRRAAFLASGIPDKTAYLVNDTSGRFDTFIRRKSIVEPMRDFADRGIRLRDVMAMSLPPGYAGKDALALTQRGVEELRNLFA